MLIPPALYKLFVKIEVLTSDAMSLNSKNMRKIDCDLHFVNYLYIYSTCILVGQSVWSHE